MSSFSSSSSLSSSVCSSVSLLFSSSSVESVLSFRNLAKEFWTKSIILDGVMWSLKIEKQNHKNTNSNTVPAVPK